MGIETVAAALELEHREVDEAIARFAASSGGERESLADAIRLLRRHIYVEEEFLFPLLREVEPGIAAPVFVMLREHGQIWNTLDSLDGELEYGGIELSRCRQLSSQLLHHNLKEEKIIYPRADEVLTESAATRLRELIASRKLPDRWVCAKAGAARR